MSDPSDRDLQTPGQIDPHEENDDRLGPGNIRDEGVPGELREDMFENARLFNEFTPQNVNDEPGFDDGIGGSISDFDIAQGNAEESGPRLADPNHDAGGEVKGPRVGGSGAVDGGPPRRHPLPGQDEQD